jgi:hypothetical protein
VRVPDEPGTIEFKAFQTYSSGEVVEWVGAADAEEPAARVNAIALPLEEGQGQLAALAALKEEVEAMGTTDHTPATDDDVEDDDDGENTGVILGGVGTVLGALALIVALMKKRA